MLRALIAASLKLRFLVVIAAAGLFVLGAFQLRKVPTDVLPEFSPPYIEIQTEALGLSAEEVESLITVPLEADLLNGVAWLESISSRSITGLSSILLFFEPGTDIIRARQMVQERLTQAHALPNVSNPPTMLQPLSSSNRVAMIGLSNDDESLSLIEMSVLARWNIKPKLTGVPGVANVSIWGQRERQLQVLVDPQKLNAQGVNLQQVINTSGNALWVSPLSYLNASYPGTGGWIETPNQRLGIRHLQPIKTPADLAQVTVEDTENLRLGDVATIVEDHQPLIGNALIDDEAGLLLVVEKFPEADAAEVMAGVETAISALAPGLSGVEFNTELFRADTYIAQSLGNLRLALMIAAGFVALALLVFLFSWRYSVVSLVAISLSLVAALLVLYYRGATLNVMVLAGLFLALTAIIDDAVTGTENVQRRLRAVREGNGRQGHVEREQAQGLPVARVVLDALLEVRRPIMFATLMLLVVVVPVYVLSGLAGAFFGALATAYALAVLASLLVALTVTPALSLILIARTPESPVSAAPEFAPSPVARLLGNFGRGAVEKPGFALVVSAALIIGVIVFVPQLRQDALLPDFKEPNLLVRWAGPPSSSRAAIEQVTAQVTQELRVLPGVDEVAAHIGRAVTSDTVGDVNTGEIWVSIEGEADYPATVTEVEDVLGAYPEFFGGVTTHLQELTRSASPDADNTLSVRVFGDDFETLKSKAAEIGGVVSGVGGVTAAEVNLPPEKPNLEIEVDLAKAEAYGLKPGDVRRAAATLLSGVQVGSLFEAQKVFDVVVWGAPEVRRDVKSVQNLRIDTPSGAQVRLAEVASVTVKPTFDTVFRQDVSRYLDVVASVSGRSLRAVARDVDAALGGVSFPIEFHAEVVGDYADRLTARRTFFGFVAAAVIAVFLLQQAAFRSWRSASVAFVGVLVSLSGGALAAVLAGHTFNVSVVAGLLAVFALAARNGVALISHFGRLHLQEGLELDAALVLRGTREKLPAIVTTAVVLAAATLPVWYLGDRAGLEVLYPMAVVLLGGLLTTTFTNLFVLPALYLRAKAEPEPEFDFGPTEAWLPGLGGGADATD